MVEMEIQLYRNPRGSEQFFYSDHLITFIDIQGQYKLLLDSCRGVSEYRKKDNNPEQSPTSTSTTQREYSGNLKVYNFNGNSNESGFNLRWFDLDRGQDVTDQYKIYDHKVITILQQLCNQPVEEKDKSNIQYGYTNGCTYCWLLRQKNIRFKKLPKSIKISKTEILPKVEENIITSIQSNVIDPQFIPYKSQTLTVPDEEGYCTCAPSISIIHCFSLKF